MSPRKDDNATSREDKFPERHQFFAWLDPIARSHRITTDTDLAIQARISPSSISSWRSGRQRPGAQSLSDIARVLDIDAGDVWAKAGLHIKPRTRAADSRRPPEDPALKLIRESGLAPKVIAYLIEKELADRERRAREAIDLARASAGSTDSNSGRTEGR